MNTHFSFGRRTKLKSQQGAALLLLMLLVLIGVSSVVMVNLSNPSGHLMQTDDSMKNLRKARELLLGWAVSHPDRPGLLPLPDLNGDGNYDGNSDCLNTPLNAASLLGKFPWRTQEAPCPTPFRGIGSNPADATGETLWYAVSANVVYNAATGQYPKINSELRSTNTGWLTVIDESGVVLSNRVAFVLLAPAGTVPGQVRGGATPSASQYLDSVTVNGQTQSNSDLDQIFVRAKTQDSFNDLLIYVTIDELIARVGNRMLRDLKSCLDSYALANASVYPWPEAIDAAVNGNSNGEFGRFTTQGITWPASCIVTKPVWADWTEIAFYKIAPAFVPGGDLSCPICLTLNGSGNYRAMIFLAGLALTGQTRVTLQDKATVTNYLEGLNSSPQNNQFISQPETTLFNDRITCVDANNVCK